MTRVPKVLLEYIQGLKTHDLSIIARSIADDVRVVLPSRTLAKSGFLEFLAALYTALPDWEYQHDEPEVRGEDRFAVKWYQGGTHTDMLILPGRAPVAPTGKQIRIPEQFFFYQIVADKIIEIRPDTISGGAPWGILEQLCIPSL
jgi:predicted ester cyclase